MKSKDIEDITYGEVQEYIEGKESNLPLKIVEKIEQYDLVRSLFTKYESKQFIIKTLRAKYKNLSKYKANNLYQDAINFFNLDNNIRKEAWLNILMNDLQNAKHLAWEMTDIETFRRCVNDQAELLDKIFKKDGKLPDEIYDKRPVIYTIKPEDVGMEKVSRSEIAKLIDNLDVNEKQKKRLKRDAMVQDVEFEIFDEDEPDTDK